MALPNPVQAAWFNSRENSTAVVAPTLIASGTATTGGSTLSVVIGYAGKLGSTGVVSTVVDNQGNTYIRGENRARPFTSRRLDLEYWYCVNAIGSVTSVTATFAETILATNPQSMLMYVVEHALPTTAVFDKHISNFGSNVSLNSGNTATLLSSGELVFGFGLFLQFTGSPTTPTTPNPTSNFVTTCNLDVSLNYNLMCSDGLSPSTAAVNASYTGNGSAGSNWICGVATFTVPAVVASVMDHLLLMGIT